MCQLIFLKGRCFPVRDQEICNYAFQITTDSPQWGGLSGCGVMMEPISWGKQARGGKNAQVYCDATIAIDFIMQGFLDAKAKRRHIPDLSWFFEKYNPELA